MLYFVDFSTARNLNRFSSAILLIVLIGASVVLAGCNVTMDFWEDDNAVRPAPLIEFEPQVEIKEIWEQDVGPGTRGLHVKLTPVVQAGRLFVATAEGEVHAYDAKTGEVLWETETEIPIRGGPGIGDESVLVGSSDGELLALSQDNGNILWKARVSSEILTTPREKDGIVIVRTVDGKLFGLNHEDGTRRWIYDRSVPALTLRGISTPVIVGDLVIAGFDGGQLVAVSIENGYAVWEKYIAMPRGRSDIERMVDIDGEIVVLENAVYVVTFQGHVAAVDVVSGNIFWRRKMSSYAGLGAYTHTLYVTDEKSHVWALNRYTGETLWNQMELERRNLTAPVGFRQMGFGEYVVVGDFEGYIHLLDTDDNGQVIARTRVDKKGILTPPIIAQDDILYVYGNSGTLTALQIMDKEPE